MRERTKLDEDFARDVLALGFNQLEELNLSHNGAFIVSIILDTNKFIVVAWGVSHLRARWTGYLFRMKQDLLSIAHAYACEK